MLLSTEGGPVLIVDSQVHIWAAGTPDRPWPGGPGAEVLCERLGWPAP